MVFALIADRERPFTWQRAEEIAARAVTNILQYEAVCYFIKSTDWWVTNNDAFCSISSGRSVDGLDWVDTMDRKIVVSIRLAQTTPAAYVVVLEVLDSTICAVLGALWADLVCVAFRPARVVCKIRERCISGVASGKRREVF